MVFRVHIELGNEAEQTSDDVASTLERVAADLRSTGASEPFTLDDIGTGANVKDVNGNTVGAWSVTSR